ARETIPGKSLAEGREFRRRPPNGQRGGRWAPPHPPPGPAERGSKMENAQDRAPRKSKSRRGRGRAGGPVPRFARAKQGNRQLGCACPGFPAAQSATRRKTRPDCARSTAGGRARQSARARAARGDVLQWVPALCSSKLPNRL